MSNLEKDPAEVLVAERPAAGDVAAAVELLEPREVPLGGPRAMTVRRTLPQRSRSLIGAWCFVDHYGPDEVSGATGMVVPPHPHTGLQTVSWLFAGEIEHRDSVGSHAMVRPGELNLMTAGRGIQHSEVSTAATSSLHGAQLWVALPDVFRQSDPRFDHFAPEPFTVGPARVSVFLGSLAGSTSPVPTFSPLVGAQIDLAPTEAWTLALDPEFEHGILVDAGTVTVDGTTVPAGTLAYLRPGRHAMTLGTDDDARILLIGGAPLGEQIVMWWNFIGRSHEEIIEYRTQWQDHVMRRSADGRFGAVDGGRNPLPAPTLPNVRLTPRR